MSESKWETHDAPDGSAEHYPDNPWAEIPIETLYTIKCTNCGCLNIGYNEMEDVLKNGYGLRQTYACVRAGCGCHKATGPHPKLLLRKEEI